MEFITDIMEFTSVVVVLILCGICIWLYSLEIIAKIKSRKRKGP